MRRFRDLISAHKRFSFGVWIVALVAVVAGAQWQLTSGGSKAGTQVLGASVKKPPAVPTITSGPSGSTNSTSATFAFKTNPAPEGYLCKLDTETEFSACSSPKTYTVGAGARTFQVEAKDGGFTSAAAARTWTVDLTPPAVPTITQKPEDPTFDTKANFAYSDTEAGVTFECQLDSAAASACGSSVSYSKVSVGTHTFTVVAVDPAGNRSLGATYGWTVLQNQAFEISGNAIGSLYPVDPSIPGSATALNLRIRNPYNFSITVATINVAVTPSVDCGLANFAAQNLLQGHPTPIIVPANQSVLLSALPAAQTTWPADWPHISLKETGLPQDGCQHTTFTLSYTGTATKS